MRTTASVFQDNATNLKNQEAILKEDKTQLVYLSWCCFSSDRHKSYPFMKIINILIALNWIINWKLLRIEFKYSLSSWLILLVYWSYVWSIDLMELWYGPDFVLSTCRSGRYPLHFHLPFCLLSSCSYSLLIHQRQEHFSKTEKSSWEIWLSR